MHSIEGLTHDYPVKIRHKSQSEWMVDENGETMIFEDSDAAIAWCVEQGAVLLRGEIVEDWYFDPIIPEIDELCTEACLRLMEAVVKRACVDYGIAKPGGYEREHIIRFFKGPSLFTATYNIDGDYMIERLKEEYPD